VTARLISDVLDPVLVRLCSDPREPRYVAEGRMVVSVYSGRRQTPPVAREALRFHVEGVLATNCDDLVDGDIATIGDLIKAIRAAERNDPTPPASAMARAA